jgi:hypothetical protein
MTDDSKNRFDAWISAITIIGSVIAFIFTLVTWREQNYIKRAGFLEAKIKDFEDSSITLSRYILDRFAVCNTCNTSKGEVSDQQMIRIGSSRKGDSTDIELNNLDSTLQEELPSTNISKQRVRLSFDRLLDFFGKLEYYLQLDLMTTDEILYFRYTLNNVVAIRQSWLMRINMTLICSYHL